MYTYIYIYVTAYTYIHIYVYTYTHTRICIYTHSTLPNSWNGFLERTLKRPCLDDSAAFLEPVEFELCTAAPRPFCPEFPPQHFPSRDAHGLRCQTSTDAFHADSAGARCLQKEHCSGEDDAWEGPAFRAPNQGVESSLCCRIAGQRLQ